MTKPLPQPDDYKPVEWLLKYIGVQQIYDKKIISALYNAAEDAGQAVGKLQGVNISDRTKRYQINLVRKEIHTIITTMFKGFVPTLYSGQQDAAQAAAEVALHQDEEVLDIFFGQGQLRDSWEAGFVQSARHGIQAMITRVLKTEIPLSKRVYKSGALASGQLDRQINSALTRGSSAREIAKLVESSIKPATAGGVSYAAMRLGRSEINNAFHAQSIGETQDTPFADEMEWHLSKVHKPDSGDKCEDYARRQSFPKDAVPPKPHPQCMCYTVPKLMEMDDFKQQLQAGGFDDYFEKTYNMPAA